MSGEPSRDPNVGGFLYVVMGALAAGLTVSAVWWADLTGWVSGRGEEGGVC
jgi:hypothetical protein